MSRTRTPVLDKYLDKCGRTPVVMDGLRYDDMTKVINFLGIEQLHPGLARGGSSNKYWESVLKSSSIRDIFKFDDIIKDIIYGYYNSTANYNAIAIVILKNINGSKLNYLLFENYAFDRYFGEKLICCRVLPGLSMYNKSPMLILSKVESDADEILCKRFNEVSNSDRLKYYYNTIVVYDNDFNPILSNGEAREKLHIPLIPYDQFSQQRVIM